MDEADLLAHEDSSLPTMLSKARTSRLCLFLCCQYPDQLPDVIVEALFSQCDTTMSFSVGSSDSCKVVGKNLGLNWTTLRDEEEYHVWMKTSVGPPDPYRVYALPPFPPTITQTDADHHIERIVREHGHEPKTDQQLMDELLLNSGEGELDGAGAILDDSGNRKPMAVADIDLDRVERQTCKTVHDVAIEQGADDGFVSADLIQDRLIDNLNVSRDDLSHESQVWGVLDMVGDELVKREKRDGEVKLRTTSRGVTLFKKISGSANDGKGDHRQAIKELYDALTDAGFDTEIEQNTIGRSSDGFASIERAFNDAVSWDIVTAEDARKARERFMEANPEMAALSGGKNVRVELEDSTGDSGPGQTLRHLHDAIEDGERCLYAARPETAWNVYDTLTDPMYCREVDENGRRRSYSLGTVKINGEPMLRPRGGKTVWWYDPDPDDGHHWHLEDTDGTQYATFKTREEIESKSAIEKYPARASDFDTDDPDQENYVNCGCPTELVPHPDLSREHWAVVIVPPGTSRAEDLSLIHHGEEILFDEIGSLNDADDLISMSSEEPLRDQSATTPEGEPPDEDEIAPDTVSEQDPELESEPEDDEEEDDEPQSMDERLAAIDAKLEN